jgi:hypothetical protein
MTRTVSRAVSARVTSNQQQGGQKERDKNRNAQQGDMSERQNNRK